MVSVFACFLTAIGKVLVLEGRLGTSPCIHPNFRFSSDFLISSDLKSEVVWQLVRQLVYQIRYTRYQVSFYLWWIGSLLNYCKVPKYYDQGCLKVFFLLSSFPIMIQISGKSAHLPQKCHFFQETTMSRVEGFLTSVFWPKSNIKNSVYTKPLNLEL